MILGSYPNYLFEVTYLTPFGDVPAVLLGIDNNITPVDFNTSGSLFIINQSTPNNFYFSLGATPTTTPHINIFAIGQPQ